MRKIRAVVRREFLERVRTRQFVIGTLFGPMLMALVFVAPFLLERGGRQKRIAVLDGANGGVGARVSEALERETRNDDEAADSHRYLVVRVPARESRGVDLLRDSLVSLTDRRGPGTAGIDGVLVITEEGLGQNAIDYLGVNAGSPGEMAALRRIVVGAVMTERLLRSGLDATTLLGTIQPVDLRATKVSRGRVTGQSGTASFALAYIMAFVLFVALMLYGVQVMTSTVEEKTSRINEVLVSSLHPFELLLGKIVGVGSVGLLQLSIWAGAAWLLGVGRGWFAGLGGVMSQVPWLAIPSIPLAALLVFLLFFVLGFFFFAAAYAAVGSTCTTVDEAQQASIPVTLFILMGMLLLFRLLGEPDGAMARILSVIPPLAPFVTPVRNTLSPLPLTELMLSVGMMILGVLIMAGIAARIYRMGILMYGKRASLGEIVRWARTHRPHVRKKRTVPRQGET